ncbi:MULTISPECIES: chemotaxis protein CheW [Methylotenera]|uniref:chemotaxis protein CheW n=1 Tax=Methylotenera TaxID=359407 RepID=UPI0003785D68|nr:MULTISPECIES: chemotaxis protein CheW [Methylotenera]
MAIDMTQFYQVFFEESEELLAEAEKLLLDLDVANPDPEHLNAIFRAAHSIKGGAATFSMVDMTEITHLLESLLDKIRKNEMLLTLDHVDAFLVAKDVLVMQLDGHRNGTTADEGVVEDIKLKLRNFAEGAAIAPIAAVVKDVEPNTLVEAASAAVNDSSETSPEYVITLKDLSEKDADNLKSELELLGIVQEEKVGKGYVFRLTGATSVEDIIAICSFIVDIDPSAITQPHQSAESASSSQSLLIVSPKLTDKEAADLQSELELLGAVTKAVNSDGQLVFNLVTDAAQAEVLSICSFVVDPDTLSISVNQQVAQQETTRSFVENVDYGFFTEANDSSSPKVELSATPALALHLVQNTVSALDTEKSQTMRREGDKQAVNQENSSIRVGVEKVDQLINLVGELVITQAMIEQRISALDPVEHERLINSVSQLTRNTRDLQEAAMSIRMMPMDYVFSRFPRMVRDLASKLGKKIEFITQGAATELDKGLIERIIDPLTHLVRNSVDHGIEMPETRIKAGKHEIGSLTLLATHRGGNIVIEVSDDGGGLNRERILAKAKQNGLDVSDNMSDSDVWQLIFAPGFSTAETVTDVSGRGVGMDVVKRNITSMNGTVEIKSALGFGTTISISLPLTLAILDGMSVSLGDSVYVIPLNLIVETLQPNPADVRTVTGQGYMVHVRGEYLPIIALHQMFNQQSKYKDPTQGVLVLIESEGKKAALFIDSLVGQQQVVIKSLETDFRKVKGVSGATIMGDGSVALILDIPAIINIGQTQQLQKEYAA